MLETYLNLLIDVLSNPEQHLWSKTETIFLTRMGIKRREAADDTTELTLNVLYNAEGRSLVTMPVVIPGEELPRP
jgi:hypothetical protein